MAIFDQKKRITCDKCGNLKFTKQMLYVADQDPSEKDPILFELEEGLFCTSCNHLQLTLKPKK